MEWHKTTGMFSRASEHVMLIQEPSKLQETLSHCSSLCWICFAKYSILRFNDWLMLNEWKTLLPGSPVFFLIWKVNWGIRNIPTPIKPENPNSWRPKSWCYYIIQINPNTYFSLIPFTYSAVYMKLRRTQMAGLTCLCLVPSQADVLCCSSYSIDRIHERDFLCKLLLPFSWWSKSCTPACHSACSDGAC